MKCIRFTLHPTINILTLYTLVLKIYKYTNYKKSQYIKLYQCVKYSHTTYNAIDSILYAMYNSIQYDTYQVGSERRCHLLPFQLLEIDIFEERLVCNIPFWASSQAKTSRRVLFQQLPNKREEGFRTVLHIQHFLCNTYHSDKLSFQLTS